MADEKLGVQFGKRIKECRKARGLTQEQLASAVGIATNTISRYEINERQPNLETLNKIAVALEMDFSDFLWIRTEDITDPHFTWKLEIDQKLLHVGYTVELITKDEDYYLVLKYPDGTLEVTIDELMEINDSANEYLKFKLLELKKKHITDFRHY